MLFHFIIGLLFISAFIFEAKGVADDLDKSAQVEAAFVYQFTNYITWPDESESPATSPFVITIVGKNVEIYKHLNNLAKAKRIRNRKIEVNLAEVSQLPESHIVIVGSGDLELLQEVTKKLKDRPTLIVSKGPDFAKKGSMINFSVFDGRLQFEINQAAIKKGKLQIGSQLLNLAKLVGD